MSSHKPKYKILIADDNEMNRELLTVMLQEEFEIVEVENGVQAVSVLQHQAAELSLVLLDIVMPEMDGFEVLAYMNRYGWIEDVPVIMISSETSPTFIDRAYEFGATDYISRPFDATVVHRRVANTIMLYAKQRKLTEMVAEQIYEKQKSNNLMVTILSHIVEFRNGESGLHVLHIRTLTELLLKSLVRKTDQYNLKQSDVSMISMASALHDIGKIAIPHEILNKPGRLTAEEFEIMQRHSMIGANMLSEMPFYQDEMLVKKAYEICRWHHERYDGGGYPDHLKGEEIPISAQIVSMADVYDALTSERCYKKAFSHDTAMEMIKNGKCGAFNPLLLECLEDIGDDIQREMQDSSPEKQNEREEIVVKNEILQYEELSSSERILQQLECERTKFQFMVESSPEIVFVYNTTPPMLTLTELGASRLGLDETVIDPLNSEAFREHLDDASLERFTRKIRTADSEHPDVQIDCEIEISGEQRLCRCICQTLWTTEDEPKYLGVIGRISDFRGEDKQTDPEKNSQTGSAHLASF